MQPTSLPLPIEFYARPTLVVAADLLGKTIWRRTSDGITGGVIVETEAYISAIDPASHNYRKPSKRSLVMFGPFGHAYIYFTYGMYYCLNVVTEPEGISAAVLIRALEPIYGLDLMAQRCPPNRAVRDLARGPGRLCQALALTIADNDTLLTGDDLWLSETPELYRKQWTIATSPRIGISQGRELFWRFYFEDHPAVSGPRVVRYPESEGAS
jgi:DNA-3-methyladenine glycosylase